MKKFVSKTLLMTGFTLFCLLNVSVGTMAWFVSNVTIDVSNGTGQTDSAYFAYGTGTENDPFGIKDTRHLNNLAWLQYNGSFNDRHYYFELANDINNGANDSVFTIPPIGTEDNPFIGVFNGNGHTIGNIKVTNDTSNFTNKPDNIDYDQTDAEIVGFFGVVGECDGSASYATSTNELIDFTLKNITVESKTSSTLIGLAAGYVNAYMNGVKIDGTATIDVNGQECDALSYTTKLSDYGLVGFSTKTGSGGTYSQDLSEFYEEGDASGQGSTSDWGGSFVSKDYTALGYSIRPTSSGTHTKTVSGQGGYYMAITASTNANPLNNNVVYRLRDGSYIPLKFGNDGKAAASNTGYLVGSNVGTGVNASPKISSYRLNNIGNALTNTAYTDMGTTYKNTNNITYTDSKLEVLTYNGGWKRILDSHNTSNNSTNTQIRNYTRTSVEDLGLQRYDDARDLLEGILEGQSYIHGIHFDNNQVSNSNKLTIAANIARVNNVNYSTTYEVPKGSINFYLKKPGYISFFAGTYNSSQVNLNFFSLYKVTRSGGTISNIKEITQIYANTGSDASEVPYVYKYSDNSYSSSNHGNTALFDIATILKGNAPVVNMLYYFELPVNSGEFAMGVAGSTQGAYMIYLDIGANAEASDEYDAYYINTKNNSNPFPLGVDFNVTNVGNNGGDSFAVYLNASTQSVSSKGTIVFTMSGGNVTISSVSNTDLVGAFSYKKTDPSFTISGLTGDPPSAAPGGVRTLYVNVILASDGSSYGVRIVDSLAANGTITETSYYLGVGTATPAASTKAAIQTAITSLTDEKITFLRGITKVVTLTRSSGSEDFTTIYDTVNCSSANKKIDVDVELNGCQATVGTITTGYSFFAGGVQKSQGNVLS